MQPPCTKKLKPLMLEDTNGSVLQMARSEVGVRMGWAGMFYVRNGHTYIDMVHKSPESR